MGDRLGEKLKRVSLVSDGQLSEGSLNFDFSIASIKANYGDIFLPKQTQI